MEIMVVMKQVYQMVKDVESDIWSRKYDSMKTGIDTAVGFLKWRLLDGSITAAEYDNLVVFLKDHVFEALRTE